MSEQNALISAGGAQATSSEHRSNLHTISRNPE
jgi:hypothetical protein